MTQKRGFVNKIIEEGKTTTSDSLCSIIVYKNPVEVTKETQEGLETFVIK